MNHDTKESPQKVKFLFRKAEDYKVIYANGAFGGITPRGDILFHFFFEHRDLPEEDEMKVEEGRIIQDEAKTINLADLKMIRDTKVGIIMSPNQAGSLAKWLESKVAEIKSDNEQMEM